MLRTTHDTHSPEHQLSDWSEQRRRGRRWLASLAAISMIVPLMTAAPAAAIHEGNDVDISNYPFMAAIHLTDDEDRSAYTCSAVLVHKQWVLTAAHCLVNKDTRSETSVIDLPEHIRVTVGVDRPWRDTDYRRVTDIALYDADVWEEYKTSDAFKLPYDIALVRLADPVRGISPIKISDSAPAFHGRDGGQELTILAWGSTADPRDTTRLPSQLQSLQVLVREDRECWQEVEVSPGEWRWDFYETAQNQFCAKANRRGFLWNKLGGARPGDSGGPLIGTSHNEIVLYGIHSHAPGLIYDSDGDRNYLGSVVVALFRFWVEQTITGHGDA